MNAPSRDDPRSPPARRPAAWRRWLPFGIAMRKPRHYRDMLRIIWENKHDLPYAWRVLTRGVCDGCALGTTGLKDWTLGGDKTHLCLVRLELLKLNTAKAFDPSRLADVDALSGMSSKELRRMGRLAYPMRRRRGEKGFTRVSFAEVWADVGARWRELHPERTAMFVTSRGVTNEVYYTAQKVMRLLGSNNVDNSARLCHSPSTSGLKTTLGVAATTCSYTDWYDADLVVFFGSNPANDQPVATKYLASAKKGGTRVLTVNAYREPGLARYWVPSDVDSAVFGTELTDRFFLVKVGGDLAFLNAVMKTLIARGAVKQSFIEDATVGYDELVASLDAQPMDALLRLCGLPLSEVEAFADEVERAERAVFVWSMGITQHAHGGDTVRAIVDLGLLREYVGRRGCGMMPIRGHSGVQGGAEMGAYATAFPGGLPIDEPTAERFSELWGFDVPTTPGLSCVDALAAADRGELDAYYVIGGNFLETMPDPDGIKRALERIPLRVHSDIVVTKQMLVEPDDVVYLLPARTRYEQTGGGTETSTERRVIYSPQIRHDIGECRSEWEMLLDLARAVDPEGAEQLGLDTGHAIRADIAAAVPSYRGIEELELQGDQFQWGGPHLCADREFPTSDGKAHFQPVVAPGLAGSPLGAEDRAADTLAADRFLLATRRGKQFNSMIQADRDPLTGAVREHVFMHPDDAAALGLAADDRILLTNDVGSYEGRVFLDDVARGTLQGHWPEVNVLVPSGRIDPGGGVPDYNAVVTVEKL